MQESRVAPMRKGEVPREAYAWGEIHWLTSQATNGAKELTLGFTSVAPGGRNPLHRHPNCEEVLYVISGEIEHIVEGAPKARLRGGEAILIPRNLKHQAINIGSVPAVLLVAFSSAQRETILEGAATL